MGTVQELSRRIDELEGSIASLEAEADATEAATKETRALLALPLDRPRIRGWFFPVVATVLVLGCFATAVLRKRWDRPESDCPRLPADARIEVPRGVALELIRFEGRLRAAPAGAPDVALETPCTIFAIVGAGFVDEVRDAEMVSIRCLGRTIHGWFRDADPKNGTPGDAKVLIRVAPRRPGAPDEPKFFELEWSEQWTSRGQLVSGKADTKTRSAHIGTKAGTGEDAWIIHHLELGEAIDRRTP